MKCILHPNIRHDKLLNFHFRHVPKLSIGFKHSLIRGCVNSSCSLEAMQTQSRCQWLTVLNLGRLSLTLSFALWLFHVNRADRSTISEVKDGVGKIWFDTQTATSDTVSQIHVLTLLTDRQIGIRRGGKEGREIIRPATHTKYRNCAKFCL